MAIASETEDLGVKMAEWEEGLALKRAKLVNSTHTCIQGPMLRAQWRVDPVERG